jgi:hypothetical protein
MMKRALTLGIVVVLAACAPPYSGTFTGEVTTFPGDPGVDGLGSQAPATVVFDDGDTLGLTITLGTFVESFRPRSPTFVTGVDTISGGNRVEGFEPLDPSDPDDLLLGYFLDIVGDEMGAGFDIQARAVDPESRFGAFYQGSLRRQ